MCRLIKHYHIEMKAKIGRRKQKTETSTRKWLKRYFLRRTTRSFKFNKFWYGHPTGQECGQFFKNISASNEGSNPSRTFIERRS